MIFHVTTLAVALKDAVDEVTRQLLRDEAGEPDDGEAAEHGDGTAVDGVDGVAQQHVFGVKSDTPP